VANTTPVFGDFLGPADEHIAAAVSFSGDLPYDAQRGVIRQLDRLLTTMARFLTDLPPPDDSQPSAGPDRDTPARAASAQLALDRAARSLRPVAAGITAAQARSSHQVAGHLAAAADHLGAGQDLLQTHVMLGPGGIRIRRSYWAPVITSEPVTSARLGVLARYTQNLALWIGQQARRHPAVRRTPTAPQLALRAAEPWLLLASAAIRSAQPARHPGPPALNLLEAIPVNAPPPRPPSGTGEPVSQLCEHIPLTAERVRQATFIFADGARWSPAATSASWRYHALAAAITGHGNELILRTLAERARQLTLEPDLAAMLAAAADDMTCAWQSWRAITGHWDILTTGSSPHAGTTPVAAEIADLALRTGRLAYRNPDWAPSHHQASPIRDPADLADTPGGIIAVLTAVHHATDAITRVAATDHQAVAVAVADNRLCMPTRLLPENYDIPSPYARAPRSRTGALLSGYDTAITATARAATALDDLAVFVSAPSSALGAIPRPSIPAQEDQRRLPDQMPAPQPSGVTHMPGRTEHQLRKLHIRDPALLLRAALIDQAAHDLVTEATTRARSRDRVMTQIPRSRPRIGPIKRPAQLASQDTPTRSQPDEQLTHDAETAQPCPTASPYQSSSAPKAHSPRSC